MPLVVIAAVASGGAAALGAGAAALVGLGTVSTITATAIGAGLISGGVTALQGGDAGDVLKSAVLGGVTTYAGGVIGAKVAGSVSSAAAAKFPTLASTFGNIAGATAAGGVSSGLMAAAYGGDPIDALIKGGLTAGLSATALSGIQAITKQSPQFSSLPDPAQRAINSALAAGTLGQNPKDAAIAELAESAGGYLKTRLKDYGRDLRDSWNNTTASAKAIEDNILLQKSLAGEYDVAVADYNAAVPGYEPILERYNSQKKTYDQLVKNYENNYGNRLGGYHKSKLDEFVPTFNKTITDANNYIEKLNDKRDYIDTVKSRFDTAVTDYDTLYNKYQTAAKTLDDTTNLFVKQETENVDIVAKTYKDLNDTKATFETELGRAPTTKELASLFNTGDIESSAGEYVAQKKWETMSPEEQLQAKLDFLNSSTADASGTVLPSKFFQIPKNVQEMPEFAPRPGEKAGDITPVLMEDGTYGYERRFTATTKDGKEYEYNVFYDPYNTNRPITYGTTGTAPADLPSDPGVTTLPKVVVTTSLTRPVIETATDPSLVGDRPALPASQPEFYRQAVSGAVSARMGLNNARSALSNAQSKLSTAQASGDADAISKATEEVNAASKSVADAEAVEKEQIQRLQEVTVEGREEAQLRLQRARQLMGEEPQRQGGPPANIVGNFDFGVDRPEIGPFGLIIEEPPATPDWKAPDLRSRFLKSSLLRRPGYKSVFDPIEETIETFEDAPSQDQPQLESRDESDMYLPFADNQPPPSPPVDADPYAYTMQNVSQATMTPEPFISQQKPEAPSFYNYGSPNALLSMTQSPFYSAPTSPTVTLAKGGLAHFARGGSSNPFAALFAATGGLGKVPHKGSHYVQGAGGGQDDLIDARLADGEYVFDADIVAALGDGSNKEGAKRLDKMRQLIRAHKRGAPNDKIPPKAKSPLAYFKEAK